MGFPQKPAPAASKTPTNATPAAVPVANSQTALEPVKLPH